MTNTIYRDGLNVEKYRKADGDGSSTFPFITYSKLDGGLPDTASGDLAIISTAIESIAYGSANSTSGTCTSSYVEALSWSCLNYSSKTINVVNNHASLTMKYRIRGYVNSTSLYYNEIQSENTLEAENMQTHIIENIYNKITVEVIDGSGHATYVIDYVGGS
jgi:hypothetical protein